MRSLILTATLAVAASGCSTTGGFQKLYPGMTAREVVDAMGEGPTRAQEFPDKSTAWYYGEDRCVLMRDDKLVSKATSKERVAVDTPVVSIRDTAKAWCAPDGYADEGRSEHQVDTPFGTIKRNIDPSAP